MKAIVFCSSCGTEMPGDSQFCPACGSRNPVEGAREAEVAHIHEPPAELNASLVDPDPPPQLSWVMDPDLGNLFRLHIDGVPASATALVDRGLSRSHQMSELAELDWPPPGQLSVIFDHTEQGLMPEPYLGRLESGRILQPFFPEFGAILYGEQPANTHPVSRYLWPALLSDGALALDADEQIVSSWNLRPDFSLIDGGRRKVSPQGIPGDVRHSRVIVTNQRIVVAGEVPPAPIATRQDYSYALGLISPTLDDMRATFRQVKRWRDQKNLWWVTHIRYEWITEVGRRTISRTGGKKTMFSSPPEDEHTSHTYLRFETAAHTLYDLSFPTDVSGQPATMQARDLLDLVTSVSSSGRQTTQCPATAQEYGGVRGRKTVELDDERSTIADAVPYSLPSKLDPVFPAH